MAHVSANTNHESYDMILRIILSLSLVSGSLSALAEQQNPPAEINPASAFAAPTQSTEAQELEAHCKSLQAKMKELKNRPLRRSAVADRYKLECQDAPYGGR